MNERNFKSLSITFVANAAYMLTFTGLIFITFRLVRYQREQNSNILGNIGFRFWTMYCFMDLTFFHI